MPGSADGAVQQAGDFKIRGGNRFVGRKHRRGAGIAGDGLGDWVEP